MSNLRDIKRKARLDLHRQMRVEALYIPSTGAEPIPIYCRVHSKWNTTTMETSGVGSAVSRQSVFPKLLFMLHELAEAGIPALRKKGIVSIAPGEAYELDNAEPPDGLSVTWVTSQLRVSDTEGLPVPGVF